MPELETVVSAFRVENILASEEHKIISFAVDIESSICTVQSVSTLNWMSGTAACKSTSLGEHIIEGEKFKDIFAGIPEAIYNSITKG